MGYSPWGHKEPDTTERLTLSLRFLTMPSHLLLPVDIDRQHSFFMMCIMRVPLSGFIYLLLDVHVGSRFLMF